MQKWKRTLAGFYILGILTVIAGCSTTEDKPEIKKEEPKITLFTAYNIWYENPQKVFAINYKRGALLPAGTAISELKVSKYIFKFKAKEEWFVIIFNHKWHPGQTTEIYRKKMFTDRNFKELTNGMTQEVVNAVLAGNPIAGMSKKEVLITYGYPPEHRTPNLLSNKWRYWMNRFNTKLICFDQKGFATKNCDALKDL